MDRRRSSSQTGARAGVPRAAHLLLVATSSVVAMAAGACGGGPEPSSDGSASARADTVVVARTDTVYRTRTDTVYRDRTPAAPGGTIGTGATPGRPRSGTGGRTLPRSPGRAPAGSPVTDPSPAGPDTTGASGPALPGFRPGEVRALNLDSMRVNRPRPVYVYVRRLVAPPARPAELGRVTGGQFRDTLPVGDSAVVCLTARKADFAVESSEGECYAQAIYAEREAVWRWTVTPLDSGPRPLNLRVTAILAGALERVKDTSYVLAVEVAPEPFLTRLQRVMKSTEAVIVTTTTLLAALVGLVVAWRKLRRVASDREGAAPG